MNKNMILALAMLWIALLLTALFLIDSASFVAFETGKILCVESCESYGYEFFDFRYKLNDPVCYCEFPDHTIHEVAFNE